MRSLFLAILAGLAVSSAACAQDTFKVKVDQPAHGRVTVTPEIPDDRHQITRIAVIAHHDYRRHQSILHINLLCKRHHEVQHIIQTFGYTLADSRIIRIRKAYEMNLLS